VAPWRFSVEIAKTHRIVSAVFPWQCSSLFNERLPHHLSVTRGGGGGLVLDGTTRKLLKKKWPLARVAETVKPGYKSAQVCVENSSISTEKLWKLALFFATSTENARVFWVAGQAAAAEQADEKADRDAALHARLEHLLEQRARDT
jgi:hypothetical protein